MDGGGSDFRRFPCDPGAAILLHVNKIFSYEEKIRGQLFFSLCEGEMMSKKSEEASSQDPLQEEYQNHTRSKQPLYLLAAWILLLVLGVFFLFAPLSDLAADANVGLPSDHQAAFQAVAGTVWASAKLSSPGITQYVTLLETTYAVHELVFGLLFLIIVAIPFRKRARWAWWACWIPMLANLTYTFTFAHFSTSTLVYSLIADIALPVLLLLHVPAFFGKS